MKKYFKLLGLALLATSMFSLTACTDDEESKADVEAAEDGVTVRFGETSWKANAIVAKTSRETSGLTSKRYFSVKATNKADFRRIAMVVSGDTVGYDEAEYPMLWLMGDTKGESDYDDLDVNYLESPSNTCVAGDQTDGYYLSGWECDDQMNVTVTDFNSSTFVISATANGTMHEVNNNGMQTGETTTLKVTVKNVTLTEVL